MQRLSHQTRCFDVFTLNLTRGCLLRGSQEIKLRPKPFEALTYLVDNPGRLISKAELIQTLWPDTAVTDDSLVQCLMEVRRALSDDAQQIIKTVPRRGYIFDKPVQAGPALLTTYTEETGVQVIIEEKETNGHESINDLPASVSHDVDLIPESRVTSLERLTAATQQHKRIAGVALLTLIGVVASAVYFTRPGEAIDSIAVMPFVNEGGVPNREYLSEGLSDSIINNLSQLPNLKVIALNSMLRYKGKDTDPQEIGQKLGVRAVLISRLTQHGDELSISTELVDVRDNRRLWGRQYSRKLTNMVTVPGEIAEEISANLRLRLSGKEKKQLVKRYTQSGEAYELYMMGRYYFRRSGKKEDLQKSIEYFEQAIESDPSYAPAYAGLGGTYHVLGWKGLMPPKDSWQKEEWAALKALQIDDTLAEAHVLTAAIKEFNLDWRGAEEEYKRALELDPNSVRAHETYAWHLEMFERLDEAMQHLKRAQDLDPLSLDLNWDLAVLFNFMRQYDRAIEECRKIVEMDPNYASANGGPLALAYQKRGLFEEAIVELKRGNALAGTEGDAQLAYAYAVAGKKDEAQKMLGKLKDEQSTGRYVSPFNIALIYMGLGDKAQAFEWLNKTFDENPYRIAFLKVNPKFDSLRSDPRFGELLRRMKLVP